MLLCSLRWINLLLTTYNDSLRTSTPQHRQLIFDSHRSTTSTAISFFHMPALGTGRKVFDYHLACDYSIHRSPSGDLFITY